MGRLADDALRPAADPGYLHARPIVVFVNGRRLGRLSEFPLAIDITDFVTYEDNQIGISVGCDTPGQFGAVTIVGLPCP
jgi:hypothetical protein